MSIITLNPYTRASSTSQYTRVSFKPDARTLFEQPMTRPAFFLTIAGALPGRRWLTYPIVVKIEDDDGEYVLTLPAINGRGFFLHTVRLLVFRWERRVEAVCPEAFPSEEDVSLCPRVHAKAFARMLSAAL